MEPTNADLQKSFDDHAAHDEAFQTTSTATSTETSNAILRSLEELHEKFGHMEQRLDSIETKIEPLIEIYNGFVFGRKAVIWTAGGVGGITVITGAIVAALKYIKG